MNTHVIAFMYHWDPPTHPICLHRLSPGHKTGICLCTTGSIVPSVGPCCRYQSAKDPSYVDYMRFSDEVESIFTRKDLEKTPTADVQQFVPPVEVNMNVLSPEEEQILQKTMHRLAERVRGRRD